MPQAGYQVIVKVWLHCKYRVTILYMHCIYTNSYKLYAATSALRFTLCLAILIALLLNVNQTQKELYYI